MSIATLILGDSGGGKSTSLRNLDPQKTLLIQCIDKPLPFKSSNWKVRSKSNDDGSIIKIDNPLKIEYVMKNSSPEIFIIDDYQHVLVNELMSRSSEKSYDKFTDIGKHTWLILNAAGKLAGNKRVYILAHTQTNDFGNIRMKTVGKMVD